MPIAPTPTPGRLAFVADGFTPGGGRAAADARCVSAAAGAGRAGAFVAFLSTSTEAGTARLPVGPPWVRPDGQVLAPTTAALLDGLSAAPVQTAAGANLLGLSILLGEATPATLATTCQDWTSALGSAELWAAWTWTTNRDRGFRTCSGASALLCLEL